MKETKQNYSFYALQGPTIYKLDSLLKNLKCVLVTANTPSFMCHIFDNIVASCAFYEVYNLKFWTEVFYYQEFCHNKI